MTCSSALGLCGHYNVCVPRSIPVSHVVELICHLACVADPLPSMSWGDLQAVQGLGPAKSTDLDRVSSNPIKSTIMRATSLRRAGGSSRDALEQQAGSQGQGQAQPQVGSSPFRSPSYSGAKPAGEVATWTMAPVQHPAAQQAASVPVWSKKKSGSCCFGAPETKETKTDALAAAARSHRQQHH